MKSRSMEWSGHVAHMEEMRNSFILLSENLTARDHLGGLGLDGRTIFEWILKHYGVRMLIGFI
jgi:hypothetical protein